MPRVYGQIYCTIWDDAEFVALGAGAQRTYFMLVTQPDIAACGALALTLRRWAKTCREADLEIWLAELTDAEFVLIDEDTEEALVRTFAKYDGGSRHAIRRKAIVSTARAIRSPLLRSTAVDELGKLGLSIGTAVPVDSHPSGTPDGAGGTPEAVESQRFQVTLGDHQRDPGILELGAAATDAAEPPSMFCPLHPNGTTDPCGPCGTARRIFDAWHAQDALRQQAATETARAARRACHRCNDQGLVEDHAGQIVGRCDHASLEVAV